MARKVADGQAWRKGVERNVASVRVSVKESFPAAAPTFNGESAKSTLDRAMLPVTISSHSYLAKQNASSGSQRITTRNTPGDAAQLPQKKATIAGGFLY